MRLFKFLYALFKYILLGKTVSNDVFLKRNSICNSCEYMSLNKCNICGCYIKYKTKWTTEKCPKNKW